MRARRALEQLRVERLDVRGQDPDDVRAAAPQALGDEAGRVSEALDHLPDVGGRLLGDAVAVVDHLRDRGDGNAGLGGNVGDRHPSVSHRAPILQNVENGIDIG